MRGFSQLNPLSNIGGPDSDQGQRENYCHAFLFGQGIGASPEEEREVKAVDPEVH